MSSFFWSIVMMMFIFFMFGLVFVQQVTVFCSDISEEQLNAPIIEEILVNFGSVQVTMLSLFKVITGGDDWKHYYDQMAHVGPMAATIYLLFIAFTNIALMNILTGLFVENAIKLAEPDRDAVFLQKHKTHEKSVSELSALIKGIDLDGDGCISDDEFTKQMRSSSGELRTYLGALDVHEDEAAQFWRVLKANNVGEGVRVTDFIRGCVKLKGTASSIDMQALVYEIRHMHRKIYDIGEALEKNVSRAPGKQSNQFDI
jgi:hypothetical protein